MNEFYTARLHMVPLTCAYLASTHAYAGDRENTLYMLYMPKASLAETKKYLSMAERQWAMDRPRCLEFAILLDLDGRFSDHFSQQESVQAAKHAAAPAASLLSPHIGSLSAFFNEERTSAELGWILAKDYWGKGCGIEAARGLIDLCVKQYGIHRFTAHCDKANIASRKIMDKLGFVLTDTAGRRKNRAAKEESTEYAYELTL